MYVSLKAESEKQLIHTVNLKEWYRNLYDDNCELEIDGTRTKCEFDRCNGLMKNNTVAKWINEPVL